MDCIFARSTTHTQASKVLASLIICKASSQLAAVGLENLKLKVLNKIHERTAPDSYYRLDYASLRTSLKSSLGVHLGLELKYFDSDHKHLQSEIHNYLDAQINALVEVYLPCP